MATKQAQPVQQPVSPWNDPNFRPPPTSLPQIPGHYLNYNPWTGQWYYAPISGGTFLDRTLGSKTFADTATLATELGLAYGAGGAFSSLGPGGSAFNPSYAGGGAAGGAGAAGAGGAIGAEYGAPQGISYTDTGLSPSMWNAEGLGVGSASYPTGGAGGWSAFRSYLPGLINSYLQYRSQNTQAAAERAAINDRIGAALGQLDPQAIADLQKRFYTQNQAISNPVMQSAQAAAAASGGRTGARDTGLFQDIKAGIPGQFAQSNLNRSYDQALNLATQRAGAYSNAPIGPVGSNIYGLGSDALSSFMLSGYLRNLGRNRPQAPQQQITQPSTGQTTNWGWM